MTATIDPASDGASPSTFEYLLPSLGADMDAGRVVEWRVAIGDEVHRGDVMAVVETEKSDIDIEIWHDGVVTELLAVRGEEIAVGTPIAVLRSVDGATSPPSEDGHDAAVPPGDAGHADPRSATRVSPLAPRLAVRDGPSSGTRSSPLARRLAAERGIDVASVVGSGPGGAVVQADIEALGPKTAPEPASMRGFGGNAGES